MITFDLRQPPPTRNWAPTHVRRALGEVRRAMGALAMQAGWGHLPTVLMVLSASSCGADIQRSERGAGGGWFELFNARAEEAPVPAQVIVLDGRAGLAMNAVLASAEDAPRMDAGVDVVGVALLLELSIPLVNVETCTGAGQGQDARGDTRGDSRVAWVAFTDGAMLRLRHDRDPETVQADYWPSGERAERPTGPLLDQLQRLVEMYRWPAITN